MSGHRPVSGRFPDIAFLLGVGISSAPVFHRRRNVHGYKKISQMIRINTVAKHSRMCNKAGAEATASHKTNIQHKKPMPDSSLMDCIPEDSAVMPVSPPPFKREHITQRVYKCPRCGHYETFEIPSKSRPDTKKFKCVTCEYSWRLVPQAISEITSSA